MKIAVIGAGSAGLAALRQSTSGTQGIEVICYEKTDQVGGTWVYREETGSDRYGLPIHTSMYRNLRTNLPKEVMGYPDYPIPDRPESYLTRTQILQFLNSYCDHFNLRQYIKFLHNVETVEPSAGERKWSIKVKDLEKDTVLVESFDAVMVCNGHYFEPSMPNQKPDIRELTEHGVLFEDGVNESVDAVFYCTGNRRETVSYFKTYSSYRRATLHESLPQVRFVLKYWTGKMDFPPKEEMLREEADELKRRKEEGLEKKHFHMMGFKQGEYYDDIANTAGITPLPPVLTKLHNESSTRFLDNLVHYRESRYRVIDDYNFIEV